MTIRSAISNLSLNEQIHEIKKQHGQVFFIGLDWFSALTLAKRHDCPECAYSVNALSTKIEIDQSRGENLFDRPTLLIVSNEPPASIAFLAWKNIQEKAQASHFPIDFFYDTSLSCSPKVQFSKPYRGY